MFIMFKSATKLAAALSTLVVIFPSLALAAGAPGPIVTCGNTGQPMCTICDIATTAQNILNGGIYIAIFLSAILFAWAGWKYVTSAGGSDVSSAKSIFTNVAIGLVLILAAWLIVNTIMVTLVKGSPSLLMPWNTIC